jgi:hypothetical protein
MALDVGAPKIHVTSWAGFPVPATYPRRPTPRHANFARDAMRLLIGCGATFVDTS